MNFNQFKFKKQFQITLNENILQSDNNIQIIKKILDDKSNFDVNQNNIILSLKNLNKLPQEVNPNNYTLIIQNLPVKTIFFKNEKLYQYLIKDNVVEYTSLVLPKNDYTLIKQTSKKIIYHVNLYQFIAIKNEELNKILNIISEKLDINVSQIIKYNALIYYVQPQSLLNQSGQLKQKIQKYCQEKIPSLFK